MPRRPYKRVSVKPDPVYNSIEVAKFINYLMIDGKKSVAQGIIYDVMDELNKKEGDGMKVLHQAINNVAPTREAKPRRLGGASYLVPVEVRKDRRLFLAINWIIVAAEARSNKEYKTFAAKLLAEISDASKNQGQAIAKKAQTEKLAEANRAFSHLKW